MIRLIVEVSPNERGRGGGSASIGSEFIKEHILTAAKGIVRSKK
jgi:hypothetical protein